MRSILVFTFFLFITSHDLAHAELFDDPVLDSDSGKSTSQKLAKRKPSPSFRLYIDPGHGGSDIGGKSQKLILEKNVTLKLASLIRKKLAPKSSTIEVLQSRLDDINTPLFERLEKANNSKASLFISLHTASAAGLVNRPISLFYHKRDKEPYKGSMKKKLAPQK